MNSSKSRIRTPAKRLSVNILRWSGSLLGGVLAAALLTATGQRGWAQPQPPPVNGAGGGAPGVQSENPGKPTPIEDKMVTIDTDNGRLVEILPDLMKSVGADYSVDGGLKNVRVTIHITKAKFKPTLDTMMKVCDFPVTYRVEKGLYHFMALSDAPPLPAAPLPNLPENAPSTKRGPLYNGGDPLAVAVSELFQFLSGCEPAFSGKGPYPNNGTVHAGTGSLSGSRSYSEYGFINGRFSSSSFETPEMANPQIMSFGGSYGYFGPINNGRGH